MKKPVVIVTLVLAALMIGPILAIATGKTTMDQDWRTANRDPVGLAPDPQFYTDAIVQVYAARAFSWRGAFGVHTWIALKPRGASAYEVLEVIGWRARWGNTVVSSSSRPPDARWYGSEPELLLDLRGEKASGLITSIREAANRYPFNDDYEVWPGPNSNTFIAYIAREVDGLDLELPVTAIGKDYSGRLLESATSGTGFVFGLHGIAGLTLALDEGIEFNLLGLSFGVDINEPALKLPGIGRIGTAHQ